MIILVQEPCPYYYVKKERGICQVNIETWAKEQIDGLCVLLAG